MNVLKETLAVPSPSGGDWVLILMMNHLFAASLLGHLDGHAVSGPTYCFEEGA